MVNFFLLYEQKVSIKSVNDDFFFETGSMWLWLSWISLSKAGWLPTHRGSFASVCTTMAGQDYIIF